MKYDYVIVGAGLYGSIYARELTDSGYNCLVIEKRNHIGGNCYTSQEFNINVHDYGCHIFHTNNKIIWDYINRFAEFNNFIFRPKVFYENKLYSFPLNLLTFYQLYGCTTPTEAISKLERVRIKNPNPKNLEEWILDKVGLEIYEIFYKHYTIKQWGREPKELPSSIIKRIPIRFDFNDNYYFDRYQGIPNGGYTKMFYNILKGIDIFLNTNYFSNRDYFDLLGKKIIYTGSIDEFFNYKYGALEYRTLHFEKEYYPISDYQGNAVIHYSDRDIPYNRIIEHKHFEYLDVNKTIITKVFPEEWTINKERLYPIEDDKNKLVFNHYKNEEYNKKKFVIGGRLGDYSYYDMDDTIENALNNLRKGNIIWD